MEVGTTVVVTLNNDGDNRLPHNTGFHAVTEPGGAAILDFAFEVPGTFLLVDHALSRLLKGALDYVVIKGDPRPALFNPDGSGR